LQEAKFLFFFTRLKQIFLGTTEFGGHNFRTPTWLRVWFSFSKASQNDKNTNTQKNQIKKNENETNTGKRVN